MMTGDVSSIYVQRKMASTFCWRGYMGWRLGYDVMGNETMVRRVGREFLLLHFDESRGFSLPMDLAVGIVRVGHFPLNT